MTEIFPVRSTILLRTIAEIVSGHTITWTEFTWVVCSGWTSHAFLMHETLSRDWKQTGNAALLFTRCRTNTSTAGSCHCGNNERALNRWHVLTSDTSTQDDATLKPIPTLRKATRIITVPLPSASSVPENCRHCRKHDEKHHTRRFQEERVR